MRTWSEVPEDGASEAWDPNVECWHPLGSAWTFVPIPLTRSGTVKVPKANGFR